MKGQVDADKIELVFVKTLRSNIEIGENFIKKEGQEYELSVGRETGVNFEGKVISFLLKVVIEFDNANEKMAAKAEFALQFLFKIENLNDLSEMDKDGQLVISKELPITLAGIAYSTARGIILNSTEQTSIGGILLPVINPINLLKDDKV